MPSLPPHGRRDVQVFEIDARPPQECRDVVEEQGEPGRFILVLRNHHLGDLPPAEKRGAKDLLMGDDFVRQLLVVRQLSDEAEDESHILFRGKTEEQAWDPGGDFRCHVASISSEGWHDRA